MRFELNKMYPFVCVKYETAARQHTDGLASRSFEPYNQDHKLLGIEVKMLTCAEHHRVPNYWDESESPELKHDGFIFKDEATGDSKWANQYPRASYGQLSDAADRIVERMLPEGTIYKNLPKNTIIEMELATYRIERIEHAIYHGGFVIKKLEAESGSESGLLKLKGYLSIKEIKANVQALTEFRDLMKAEVEKVAGRQLTIKPVTHGPAREVLEGEFCVQFADEEDCSYYTA